MKRRSFLRNIGVGASGLLAAKHLAASESTQSHLPNYTYPNPTTLAEAVNADGHIVLRIAIGNTSEERALKYKGKVSISGGKINRQKNYFFETEDEMYANSGDLETTVQSDNMDVIVFWLDKFSSDTIIKISGDINESFTLQKLIDSPEVVYEKNGIKIISNLLFDKEIGFIDPKDFGGKDPGNAFMFTAMGDPQGGDAFHGEELRTRIKIHNAFIEESVQMVNNLPEVPEFNMVIGDVCDAWGYDYDLKAMNEMLGKLKCPVLYEIGNHETLHKIEMDPGYNMQGFENFLSAQKEISGIDKLLYSFNMGKWHFIVWPDPLRPGFWERHPHYFDWLEQDLNKHSDRPVMLFQHVPVHPIGITPHINYAESVFVKRLFLDILSTAGNVKYVLSGHVHIPIKAAFKTAVNYKGINLINLPAAGYRPRNFGEEDFFGGPSQGAAIINIEGEKAKIKYRTVTEDEYEFPSVLPDFDDETFALWLRNKWELPAEKQFVNGNFEDNTKHWVKRYTYIEDENPANICEARKAYTSDSFTSLYLFNKVRGYQAPGQDRYPQDGNRICQAVSLEKGKTPYVSFDFMLDGKNCDFNGYAGGYAWIEGYSGSTKLLSLSYSAHKIWVNIGGAYSLMRYAFPIFFDLNRKTDVWQKAIINVKEDYERGSEGEKFDDLGLDRLVLNFGVWNLNDGPEQPFGIYFDNANLSYDKAVSSNIDGVAIQRKEKKDEWWRGKIWKNANISGEHRYVIPTDWKID